METWKTIPDYPSYMASTLGRIKRLAKTVETKNHMGTGIAYKEELILTPSKRKGYDIVCMTENKKNKTESVHRLIALTFLKKELIPFKTCVHHKDGTKSNNRLDNLEIISYRRNTLEYRKEIGAFKGSTNSGSNSFPCRVQVRYNGKKYNVGNYKTEDIAKRVYFLFLRILLRYNITEETDIQFLITKLKNKFRK